MKKAILSDLLEIKTQDFNMKGIDGKMSPIMIY